MPEYGNLGKFMWLNINVRKKWSGATREMGSTIELLFEVSSMALLVLGKGPFG